MPYIPEQTEPVKATGDVGYFESALAGIATGIWNIPKGFFSLGAEIYDLIGDTDKAKEIEKWFESVNPFEESAEAQTIGRITKAIAQLAPISIVGAVKGAKYGIDISKNLAQRAIEAKQNKNYFNLYNIGSKIAGSTSGAVVGAGLGASIVSDEDIGTFADMLRGTSLEPYALTMMDIKEKEGREEAYRRLLNRVKFGTENALFDLALIGAGKGISALRKPTEREAFSEGKYFGLIDKSNVEKNFTLSSSGNLSVDLFGEKNLSLGNVKAATAGAYQIGQNLEKSLKNSWGAIENQYINKPFTKSEIDATAQEILNTVKDQKIFKNITTPEEVKKAFWEDTLDVMTSREKNLLKVENKKLVNDLIDNNSIYTYENKIIQKGEAYSLIKSGLAKDTEIFKKINIENLEKDLEKLNQPTYSYKGKSITEEEIQALSKEEQESVLKSNKLLIDRKDYFDVKNVEELEKLPKFKKLSDLVEKSGGDVEAYKKAIIDGRFIIDNQSIEILKKGGTLKNFDAIKSNIGSYGTTYLQQYNKLDPLKRYEVMKSNQDLAVQDLLLKRIDLEAKNIDSLNSIDKELALKEMPDTIKKLETEIREKQVIPYIEKIKKDEFDLYNKQLVKESELVKGVQNIKVNPSILMEKVLEPWQRRLRGEVFLPQITLLETIGKQVNLNQTLRLMNSTKKLGTNIEVNYIKKDGKQIKDSTYLSYTEEQQKQIQKKFIDKTTGEELKPITNSSTGKIITPEEQMKKRNSLFTKEEAKIFELDTGNINKFVKIEPIKGFENLTGLEGMYMKAPIHHGIFETADNLLSSTGIGRLYSYSILAPKAASQIAKTILSVTTHVRNFVTAGAFAAANGAIFPNYGDIKLLLGEEGISRAFGLNTRRVLGTMTDSDKELYQRLLRVNVAGTQVEARQIGETGQDILSAFNNKKKLTEDSKDILSSIKNPNEFQVVNKMTNKLSNVYRKFQDAYVAEDDFWKTITWNLERNRFENIFSNVEDGITGQRINPKNYRDFLNRDLKKYDTDVEYLNTLSKEEKEIITNNFNSLPKIQKEKIDQQIKLQKFILNDKKLNRELVNESYQSFLDEFAGNLTRNQVPNYDFVGSAGKNLRLTPFGNFIAFPLEMIRTGNNIYTQSIKEITSGIPEIEKLGYRRLISFGTVALGVPLAVTETFKALNNVTDEELTALRRFVPFWSKNSTLVPTGRDDKGYIKYIDFSYANPYDTLIRPFNAIMASIAMGKDDKKSLYESLGKGLIEGTSELLNPFTSESIFTEALVDSTLRRGIGREGKRVWSEEDDPFVKIVKSIGHVADSFTPGSLSQLKRLHIAAVGKSDDYGKTFELKDELPGIFGFRSIQSDPENGLKYKVTQFGSRLDKDRNLFSSPLLKGGRVDPEDIVSSYQYSEARRFQTMKDMHLDIQAAKKLGVSSGLIENKLKQRKGMDKDVISNVMKGRYLPDEPNKFFIDKMQEITNELNKKENIVLPNPYFQALPGINTIKNKNKRLNLLTDIIEIPTPSFSSGTLEPQSILPAGVNTTPAPIINNQLSSLSNQQTNPITGLTETQVALLSPSEQLIQQRLNKKKPITIVA